MGKIAVLADSGCQLEIGKNEDEGIFIAPLTVTIEGKTYRDQIDITSIEAFNKMASEDVLIKTSQPSTGDVVEALERIKALGYTHVIGLPIATGLSSSLNGMQVAADMVEIPITLVDTKGTAGNQKYLVKIAAQLIKENKSVEEIETILTEMVEHSGTIIMVPNLDHLKKGGRITPAVALLAGMLKIVPVMELNYDLGGRIDTLAKVRTEKKARITMVDRMIELGVKANDYKLTIEHVLCEESALQLKEIILDKIGNIEIELRELPVVVGAHMGIGGLGVQYIRKYAG